MALPNFAELRAFLWQMQTGFVRIEGPEEITPQPIAHVLNRVSKERSFDSLSAANALCNSLPACQLPVSVSLANEALPADQPSSPSLAAAAAALQQVQSTDMLEEAEGAVDCLMQLSSDGTMKPSLLQPPKKRPLAITARESAPSSRCKLKMKASPLSQSSTPRFGASPEATMQPLYLLSSSNPGQVSASRPCTCTHKYTAPTRHPPPPPPILVRPLAALPAQASGRCIQAVPDADRRAARCDREPRGNGRGPARQLVPEPPSATGVGGSAAPGEPVHHALDVLRSRGRRRRPPPFCGDAAAARAAGVFLVRARVPRAMAMAMAEKGLAKRAGARQVSQMLICSYVSRLFLAGGGDLSLPTPVRHVCVNA